MKLPTELAKILFTWFETLIAELTHRVKSGCHRFPTWQDPIRGPVNQLQRRRLAPKVKMTTNLQRHLLPLSQSITSEPPDLSFGEPGETPEESAFSLVETPLPVPTLHETELSYQGFESSATSNTSWSEVPAQHSQYMANADNSFEQMLTDHSNYSDFDLFGDEAHRPPLQPGDFGSDEWATYSPITTLRALN